jgi:hypothetical protein
LRRTHIWVYDARMTAPLNLYDYVMACFRARAIPQRTVAAESGVPFSTVAKIAQGSVADPSVHNVQKLADYFASKGVEPVAESREAA